MSDAPMTRVELARAGAELIGEYWDECGAILAANPVETDTRHRLYERANDRLKLRLSRIGLEKPGGLPGNKGAAMEAAYKHFLRNGRAW